MKPARKPLQERLSEIERRLDALEADAPPAQPAPTPVQTPAPPLAPEASQPPLLPPEPDRRPIDLERLLRWSGGVLLVLAATFLLSVALERGWLTPTVRLVGGIGVGLALVGLGVRVRPRSDGFATTLIATGAVITYLMVWAGYELYALLGPWTAGVGMVLVVGGCLAEVLRSDDVALASLATLGGFAVPFLLLAAGEDPVGTSAVGILVYLATFLLLTGAVHLAVGWRILQIVAAGAAVLAGLLVLLNAAPTDPSNADAIGLSVYFGLVAIVFWALPALLREGLDERRARRLPAHAIARGIDDVLDLPVRLAGFPLLLVLLGVVGFLWELGPTGVGTLAFVLAGLAALVALAASDLDDVVNWLLSAGLVAVGLVLVLDERAIGTALLAEGAAILLASRYAGGHTANRVAGHVVGGVGAVVTLVVLHVEFGFPGWGTPVATLVAVGVLAAGGWSVSGRARAAWWGVGYVVAMLLVRHLLGDGDVGVGVTTAAWALVGLGLLLVGRRDQRRPLEVAGWSTLAVVGIRLFDHLGDLEPLVRVLVFFGIGALFLGGGWLARSSTGEVDEEEGPRDRVGG